MIGPPAPRPCVSCPYRRDVPSGLWDAEEYAKLPLYDLETPFQHPSVFLCHQQDGRLCAGWVAVHDMYESLGLRVASLTMIEDGDLGEILDYETDVPLFASGAEAAAHGTRELESPSSEAKRAIAKLKRRRELA